MGKTWLKLRLVHALVIILLINLDNVFKICLSSQLSLQLFDFAPEFIDNVFILSNMELNDFFIRIQRLGFNIFGPIGVFQRINSLLKLSG